MDNAAGLEPMALDTDQDRRIVEVVEREQSRLRRFIRRRVPDARDVEDILQDVFYELVEANRLLMPIDHVPAGCSAWRVTASPTSSGARSRRGSATSPSRMTTTRCCGSRTCCPRPRPGRRRATPARALLDQLELAIEELPAEQREVFVAHELEGRSFKAMAAEAGVSVNTLLSRKRYAVLHLRARLQEMYDQFTKA